MRPVALSNISSSPSKVATLVSRAYLPIGRLYYAGASGLSLVIAAALTPRLAVVGEYIYQVGFASAIATIASLGLDRMMARRIAAGSLPVGWPTSVVRFRSWLAAALIVAAGLAGLAYSQFDVFLACGFFVVSRMFYADVEAVWIAARLGDRTLFLALVLNGSLTAAGIIVGSFYSSVAIIALSSLGNVLAFALLLSKRRLPTRTLEMGGAISEAGGIAASLVLAVVYARVDLVILASLGSPLESVALYGIVTRMFDALVLVRGAAAQEESRAIASLRIRTRARRLRALTLKVQLAALLIALLGLSSTWLLKHYDLDFGVISSYFTLGMMFVALPLFLSHLPTAAMIYSDRRTHRLLLGSVITCVGSVAVKWLLISTWGLDGAVLAIGLVESISALVFFFVYWSNARSWRSSQVVWVPLLAGFLLLLAAIAVL